MATLQLSGAGGLLELLSFDNTCLRNFIFWKLFCKTAEFAGQDEQDLSECTSPQKWLGLDFIFFPSPPEKNK